MIPSKLVASDCIRMVFPHAKEKEPVYNFDMKFVVEIML